MSKERIGSLIFLAVGIYGLIFSTQLPFGEWNEPGPAVFPFTLSVLLTISSVLWLILGKRKEGAEEEKGDRRETTQRKRTPLKILALTAVFVLAFKPGGYLLTSFLYLFLLFFWVSRFRVWVAIGLAIVLAVVTWYGFGKLLEVQLPQGILPL